MQLQNFSDKESSIWQYDAVRKNYFKEKSNHYDLCDTIHNEGTLQSLASELWFSTIQYYAI